MIIKRVGPLSAAKITGTLYGLVGLVGGAVFSMIALLGGFASGSREVVGFGALFGVGAIVIFPILYGGLGFLTTLFGAWLYNVVAGFVGGVEMDIQ
jgi:hypothetical protein